MRKTDLQFNQIVDLVKQLPKDQKIKLLKEPKRDIVDAKLSALLNAFKTNELGQRTINEEVEIVRAEIYTQSKS